MRYQLRNNKNRVECGAKRLVELVGELKACIAAKDDFHVFDSKTGNILTMQKALDVAR